MGQLMSEPDTTKTTSRLSTSRYEIGVSSMQGWRVTMEDAHVVIPNLPTPGAVPGGIVSYFAVFDGHGGRKVADYISFTLHKHIIDKQDFKEGKVKTAVETSFVEVDAEMRKRRDIMEEMSGSTAIVVLIRNNTLFCANLGDSRAVACVGGRSIPLSFDHKPTNPEESERIVSAGGFVEAERVNGSLALSRAFGDFQFKMNPNRAPAHQIVSSVPDVMERELDPSWEFLVIACDGIWEVMANDDVIAFVRSKLEARLSPDYICEQLMDRCLATDSLNGGPGCDNMTVVIVVFKWPVGDS